MAEHAPVLLFGVTSVIAGGLSTSFPETLNKKLPDTVNQAKMVDDLWKYYTDDDESIRFMLRNTNVEMDAVHNFCIL